MSSGCIGAALIVVLATVLGLAFGPSAVGQSMGTRCDGSSCYQKVCTPGPQVCGNQPNHVCRPMTKEECTTQNVQKCRKVPLNTCNTQGASNSCPRHVKRVCGYNSRYRTYAAEGLGYYKKTARLRPRYRQSRAVVSRCHLTVVSDCHGAPRHACKQVYKDECNYVPEKSCHNRQTQECRDEPKYVCDEGPEICRYVKVAKAPSTSDPPGGGGGGYVSPPAPTPSPPGGGGGFVSPPSYKKTGPEETPPSGKKSKQDDNTSPSYEKKPPSNEETKPDDTPPPYKEAKPYEPPRPSDPLPPPAPVKKGEPSGQKKLPEVVINVRRVLVPIAGGLAATGLLLLFVSRRRKSQANDSNPQHHSHIAYVGRSDPGAQEVTHLATPPIGPRITVRTVPGERQVEITLG